MTLQEADGSLDSDGNKTPLRSTATRVTSFTTVLDGLMETRTVVSVLMQTGNEYGNMMITSFRAPRIAGRSGSVTFLIDMQEIVLADPVKVVRAAERSEPGLKQKKTKGRGSTTPVSPETKEANRLRNIQQDIDPGGFAGFELFP
jgi:hypothetical protein